MSPQKLRKNPRSNVLDKQGVSCLDCETRLDGQEDTSAGKLHGCSEVVLHAPQEVGTEEDGLENTGKNRPPLLVAVCLCHSLQKAERKKKITFIDVQSGSLAPQLFNCLTIVQYVLKAAEECGNGGTPTPVTFHTPSHGSIPVPSAPLWGGERGQSGVKGQGAQGLTQGHDHSFRVVVFKVRDGLRE